MHTIIKSRYFQAYAPHGPGLNHLQVACWPRLNHLHLAKRAGCRRCSLLLLGQAQGLVLGCLAIAHRHPVNHPIDSASRPTTAALHAAVAPTPPHSVAPVAALQPTSSCALGASFVDAPVSRAITPVIPPDGIPPLLVTVAS